MNATYDAYTPRSLKGSGVVLFVFPSTVNVSMLSEELHKAGTPAGYPAVFIIDTRRSPRSALVYTDENRGAEAAKELVLRGFRFEVWSGR